MKHNQEKDGVSAAVNPCAEKPLQSESSTVLVKPTAKPTDAATDEQEARTAVNPCAENPAQALQTVTTVVQSESAPVVVKAGLAKSVKPKRKRTKVQLATSVAAKIAVLTALATVLMLLEFPIFPYAPFLKLNFADLPGLIGSFILGPIAGGVISVLRVGLFVLFRGTTSAFVGELSNITSGIMFTVPAGLIYLFRRKLSGAIIGLAVGSFCMILSMCLFNYFVLLPFYASFMPALNEPAARLSMVFTAVLPFNAIKCAATSVLTFFLYKQTHRLFNLF